MHDKQRIMLQFIKNVSFQKRVV